MSQSAEMDTLSSLSNGFWEIGNYKANVQRIHQGSEQLEDIARFIKERIAIENNYSKHLERWNEEWAHYSEKNLKEGTLKGCFDLLLEESHELSKAHQSMKDRFNDEVLKTIELFKRDNYHKSTFRGFKEAKEIEDEFEKAQKQWKKLFERVESSKRAYHALARAEKSAYIQFMNSKADQSIADSASEKCKERYERNQEELKKARGIYEQQVQEISSYNSIYMENMAFVFEKCQRMEMKRLRFVLEMLSGMQKILVDLLNPPKMVQLHTKLRQLFLDANDAAIGEDLKRWSMQNGVDSNTKWPQFEEYSGEFRQIHAGSGKSRQRQQHLQEASGVVLTKKVVRDEDGGRVPPLAQANGRTAQNNGAGGHWRSSSQQPRGEWTPGTGTGSNSICSEPIGATETEGREMASNGGGGGGHFLKQNSVDSQHSRDTSTSKSSRSQSEKPQPRAAAQSRFHLQSQGPRERLISRPQQPIDKFNTCPSSALPLDPLATDAFPMVTPQKGGQSGNGGHAGSAVEFKTPDFALKNGGRPEEGGESSAIRRDAAEGGEGGGGGEQLDSQQPPMPVGPARVIYDYKPQEDDEMQLAKGELIEVLSGPDDLGWCLGVKKNRERGLFPAGYVQSLNQN